MSADNYVGRPKNSWPTSCDFVGILNSLFRTRLCEHRHRAMATQYSLDDVGVTTYAPVRN